MITIAVRRILRWSPAIGFPIAALALCVALPAQGQRPTGAVAGIVTDAHSSAPLQGVALEVVGTRLGGTTGSDGRYRITGIPAGSYTLVARRIGYASGRRPITVTDNGQATIDFALQASAAMLDQVVVTGTAGAEERRAISNAVATVDLSTEREKPAATSLTSLLNARAPGVTVGTTSGRIGAVPSIQIRGRNSLS